MSLATIALGAAPASTRVVGPLAWQEKAACRSWDPELFFDDRDPYSRHAKAVCAGCPVRRRCLDWITEVEAGQHYTMRAGIFAGLSRMDRWRRDPVAVRRSAEATARRAAQRDAAVTS